MSTALPTRTARRASPAHRIARLFVAVAVAVGAVGGSLLIAGPASAADIPAAVTSQTLESYTLDQWAVTKLDFVWAVPDSANSGDTFTIELPTALQPRSTASFSLLAPNGVDVVATAVWSGKTATFTLTPYADIHDSVGGTGYFSVSLDSSVITDAGDYDVTLGGKIVRITRPESGDEGPIEPTRDAWKGAWWATSDQGTSETENALYWGIWLPASVEGLTGPVVITDTLGPGQAMDCTDISIEGTAKGDADPSYTLQWDFPARIIAQTCGPDGFTLTLDQILPYEKLTIVYNVSITDTSITSYSNEATISNTNDGVPITAAIERDEAGGNGSGVVKTTPPVAPPVTDVQLTTLAATGPSDALALTLGGLALLLLGTAIFVANLLRDHGHVGPRRH